MPSCSGLPGNSVNSSAAQWVLLLALLVSAVPLDTAQAQDPTSSPSLAPSTSAAPTVVGWGGCVDPTLSSRDESNKVTIGDETTVCLQLGNGDNWAAGVDFIHYTLQPKADEYTRFFAPSSYVDFVAFPGSDSLFRSNNITVGITSQDHLSYLRRYYDFELGRIYPYLTAIINVTAGEVTGISWDDACEFCGSNTCEENTVDFNGVQVTEEWAGPTKGCYITQEECNRLAAEQFPIICDVLVYVVWTGTDSTGKRFQSAGSGSGAGMTLVVMAMTVAMVGAGWS